MHPPQNTRSVPRQPASSTAFSRARNLPRFIPLPTVALQSGLPTAALSVITALLSRSPYAWDRLLSGSRLVVKVTVDELAASARISANTLRQALAELARCDLVQGRGRRSGGSLFEIMPAAFGLPDDDLERRRRSPEFTRRYVPIPVALASRLGSRDLAVAIAVIEAAGVGVLSRAVAGESIWVSITASEIATSTGLSTRTARRSLEALGSSGFIAGRPSRGGEWAIELGPEMFGLENRTNLRIQEPESDKSAFSAPSHPYNENEEGKERKGVRSRAASIALSVHALSVANGLRVSSGRWRARIRRVALQLAVAGATDTDAEAIAVTVGKQRGRPAPPEAILDRYLGDRHRRSHTALCEAQFVGTASVASEPQAPPPELATRLDDLELRVWRWRAEIEAGDPAGESFRELLGGHLPWEETYELRSEQYRRRGTRRINAIAVI